jgi:L-ascorbate metabolism protein UlaG (beta-lactamase superfamily)
MRVTHLGHSCLLVEAAGARVLLDPGTFSHGFEELSELDAVVITHQHVDHLDAERLPLVLETNDRARLFAEPEVAVELTRVGLDATPLHPGDAHPLVGLEIAAVGGEHAVIHPDVPRVGNVGVLLRAAGEPTLFHPGDAIDTTPEGVDVVAVPVSAPWAAVRETVEFLRAAGAGAGRWVPIHDGLLGPAGRALYLRLLTSLGPEGCRLTDLVGEGATTI